MNFYAHTQGPDKRKWEPLFTPFGEATDNPAEYCSGKDGHACPHCEHLAPQHGHLNKVAHLAANFAAEMFPAGPDRDSAKQWGYLAGLWHDLGKFAQDFQNRIRGNGNRANHSTAGGQLADDLLKPIGPILTYPILGHHAGLADYQGNSASLTGRLAEFPYLQQLTKIIPIDAAKIVKPLDSLPRIPINQKAHSSAFFTRMLFSCLVDADFLATEKFCDPNQASLRREWPSNILDQMRAALTKHLQTFPQPEPGSINEAREKILNDCRKAASKPTGFHTLTVPTGGGKTLSSLAFALEHAIKNNLNRIIYIIPFTSIIEQNAQVFREIFSDLSKALGHPLLLEHHSNFDPSTQLEDDDIPIHKLAGENWDCPLVITTNVQFFESLAHHKTSRCRKLHNLSRSVLIFDEAQAFPPDHLTPCLGFLNELVTQAASSVVLCSATQPAFGKLPEKLPGDFIKTFNKIALPLDRSQTEIIPDVPTLFSIFKRTNLTILPNPISDEELIHQIASTKRSLTILNTKPHASKIFAELCEQDLPKEAPLHLSAQLAPAHRQAILREIHHREEHDLPCLLISTTVVEAGVDLSFPSLFRSLTGLDSLAQALGRCNRHGKLLGPNGKPIPGQAVFFESSDQKTPNFLKFAVNATRTILRDSRYQIDPNELLTPTAIEAYFRHAYWQHGKSNGDGWDKPNYRTSFGKDANSLPFRFDFRTFSKSFRLIPDEQEPVIIEPQPSYMPGLPTSDYQKIPRLLDKIREADIKNFPPPPGTHRTLQRFTVQVPRQIYQALLSSGDIQTYCDNRFPILTHPQSLYDEKLGLQPPAVSIPKIDQLWYV